MQYSGLQKKEIVLGINSDADTMSKGTNNNVRLFSYSDDKCVLYCNGHLTKTLLQLTYEGSLVRLQQEKTASTIETKNTEIYQKITNFSPDGSMLAVASSESQVGFAVQ